ncbi:MAG: type IX secretion system protein PorQ [Clostridiales bacterium]|nr:type IX secretion system protein PorQ [Clostridiales bacterium]
MKTKTLIKRFLGITALALTVLTASGQDGSTAYNFLNVTSSAYIYGLGGINITNVTDNINSIDQNPALLGGEMSGQIGINYMRYLGDSNFAGARYSHSAGEYGAWSAGIRYFGYGKITAADETGAVTGSFSPKDVAFNGTFSYDIYGGWRGGINLNMLYSSYEQYSAMAVAADLGVNYYDPDRDLSFSIVGANIGGQLKKFNDKSDRLPIDLRVGWAQSFSNFPVRFSVTAWNLTKWHLPYIEIKNNGNVNAEPIVKDNFSSNLFRHLIFGAELISSDKFYLTLGYNYKTRTDMSTYSRNFLSGFSIGAGLNARGFKVAAAMSQPHTGATTFMLNLTLNLSDLIN